jgi:hypothetical protein
VTLSLDKTGTGAGWYVSVIGRRVPGAGDYRAKLRAQSSGLVAVSLERASGTGAETVLVPATAVPGLTYTAGATLRVRLQVFGTSPTLVRAKVWRTGSTEPAAWAVSSSDGTVGLQAAGGIGLHTYLSSSATVAPLTLSVDDLLLVTAQP